MLVLNPLIQICIRLANDFIAGVTALVALLKQDTKVTLVESISVASWEFDLFVKTIHLGESVPDKILWSQPIVVCVIKQLRWIKTFVRITIADLIFSALERLNISASIHTAACLAISDVIDEAHATKTFEIRQK